MGRLVKIFFISACCLLFARRGQANDEALVAEDAQDESQQQSEFFQQSKDGTKQRKDRSTQVSQQETEQDENEQHQAEQAQKAERLRTASSTTVRLFHEVLDELLAEFGYDVKIGQIKGLSNLAIRKVRVSNAIPKTYEDYVEMLITERLRENSRIKLIACVPCKTRTSSIESGRLVVSSPITNLAKLESAAATLGIENFMDAVLVYHTTHMVFAVSIFNAQTKELVWTRTYNSETIKSRYQRLAVDYSQVKKTEPGEDYKPDYRYMFGLGGASMPNVAGDSSDRSMLTIQIRATEKFNNRRTEFGMMVSLLKTADSIVDEYPSETTTGNTGETSVSTSNPIIANKTGPQPKPFQNAFGIYGVYGHVFVGAFESYNELRHGLHIGAGGLAATGYLAPAFRAGYDLFFGRRFVVSFAPNYIAPATVLVKSETILTKGGVGFDGILSLNF